MLSTVFLALCLLGISAALNIRLPFASSASRRASVDELKQNLIAKTKDTQNGISISKDPTRLGEIEVIINQLNRMNKNRAISSSPLLNGSWKLAFTTNVGSSAGKVGPFVGDVVQDIYYAKKYYVNRVSLGQGIFEAALTANWKDKTSSLWEVTFQQIEFKVLGLAVLTKELKAIGTWRLTYCDDSMRILYAKGGKNAEKENVYVLYK